MAFVRKKQVGQYEYHYLVENRREAGRTRQRIIAYLGEFPTAAKALVYFTSWADGSRQELERLANEVHRAEDAIPREAEAVRRAEEEQNLYSEYRLFYRLYQKALRRLKRRHNALRRLQGQRIDAQKRLERYESRIAVLGEYVTAEAKAAAEKEVAAEQAAARARLAQLERLAGRF